MLVDIPHPLPSATDGGLQKFLLEVVRQAAFPRSPSFNSQPLIILLDKTSTPRIDSRSVP